MQNQAIEVAQDAMDKFSIEKDIAQYIKKEVCVARRSVTGRRSCCTDVESSVRLSCWCHMALYRWTKFWKLRDSR